MGIEILREQVVRVCWLDAAWLREVLPGCYRHTELMALAADLCADLVQTEAGSSLPVVG